MLSPWVLSVHPRVAPEVRIDSTFSDGDHISLSSSIVIVEREYVRVEQVMQRRVSWSDVLGCFKKFRAICGQSLTLELLLGGCWRYFDLQKCFIVNI